MEARPLRLSIPLFMVVPMGYRERLLSSFFADRHRWILWAPVFLGSGIAGYFNLPFEPSQAWAWGGLLLFCLSLWGAFWRLPRLAIGFIGLGFAAAFVRTHSLHPHMLHYPLPPLIIEGRVAQVELRPTKTGRFFQRILLTHLKIDLLHVPPQKVRLTCKGQQKRLWPGDVIRIRAKLAPVADPTLPGGFDFRRQAYFQEIGATGFALSRPEIREKEHTFATRLEKRREKITAFFLTHMKPPTGAIAAALITGDKAAIPERVREDFIQSGLAHILAISGLHLTIIAGVVFMVIRRGLALIPSLCLAFNSKKIAALGTILMTFGYLVLSGFGVPAQRAFIMISLVMGAIMIDRSALSMRTVALAAFLILLTTPEALLGPSFQLSFAAVIGLIAGYETWRTPLSQWMGHGGMIRKLILYGSGLAFTSFLATCATLPLTLTLFHRFSLHAIESNLLAVPLTSLVIMPSAFLTCLLAPLGLGAYPLGVFENALRLLLMIAKTVGSWPGSYIPVAQPPTLFLPLVVFGSLWICLWQQPWRRWGVIPLGVGLVLVFCPNPPHILIDGQGKVAALLQDGTLSVSSTRKGKFTIQTWAKQWAVREVQPLPSKDEVAQDILGKIPVIIAASKTSQPCVKDAILIRLEPSQKSCPAAMLVIDWFDLWRGGAHSLRLTPQGLQIETVRKRGNYRPWEKQPRSRRRELPELTLQ